MPTEVHETGLKLRPDYDRITTETATIGGMVAGTPDLYGFPVDQTDQLRALGHFDFFLALGIDAYDYDPD